MTKELIITETGSRNSFREFCASSQGVQIDCVNWPAQYPDKPRVVFYAAYTREAVLLRFEVAERFTLARVKEDNGPVWTDSCVECFIALDDTGYYNFEFNCLGVALLAFRKEKEKAEHASRAVMDSIVRISSLAGEDLGTVRENVKWSLDVEIPMTAFFRHGAIIKPGYRAKGNFYKCGDGLPEPHFLSWNPVGTAGPDFHREEFFGHIVFE